MKKIREGYKMTDLGEIPIDWEIKRMSDISEINPKKEIIDDDKDISFITMEDVSNKGRVLNSNVRKYGEVKKGYTAFKNNDVLLAKITPCFENGKKAIVSQLINEIGFGSTEFHVLRANKNDTIPSYIYYIISTNRFMQQAQANMTGSAGQKRVPTEFLKEYEVATPPLKEQQKISLILSSLDEQLEIIDRLIEKTKELKKGLMQRLLTKGIGHSRFKDTEIGKMPEGWEVRRLIDISQGKGEYGIGAVATEYVVGNPRYLRITDIGDESRLLFNDIKGLDDEEYEKYLLKYNDIVFARTGNTTGKSYVYNVEDGDLVYAGFLIKFSINPKLANVNFIKYVIQSKRFWDWVNVMSTRSGQPGINSNEYAKLLIQVPSIEEQNQIALVISSVDEKIEQYETKKEKLQELKKGLMQKLLTGKIRGKVQ